MLGFEVAQSTVSKYMVRPSKPPSQSWKTFLRNHAQAIAAIDLCVVPTLTFDRLFAFLVLGHDRRQLLWIEVTRHPTAEWLARQITEAFPWKDAPLHRAVQRLVPLSLFPSWQGCITSGYDFRKVQVPAPAAGIWEPSNILPVRCVSGKSGDPPYCCSWDAVVPCCTSFRHPPCAGRAWDRESRPRHRSR